MTHLKYSCALIALLAGAGMAHAGTITITEVGGVDNYKYTAGEFTSGVDSNLPIVNLVATEVNDNAVDIDELEARFQVNQTEPATDIDDAFKTPLEAAGLTAARNVIEDIDAPALKGEWEVYLNHVEEKAAAGEEITMARPNDPTDAQHVGDASDLAGALVKLGEVNDAVSDYSGAYDTFVSENAAYNTYTTASGANASGRAAAEAFANEGNLANGILASFNAVDAKIGDISTLPSDLQAADPADTTVVSAVTALNEKVGSLDDLNSSFTGTARDNVVAAVNSNADRITANTDAIASNSSRIVSLEEDVDELQAGVAMAIAIANAPIIQGGMNGLSLSGGFGHFKGKSAGSMKAAFMPMENVAITASVATDFDENVAAGAGIGFSF